MISLPAPPYILSFPPFPLRTSIPVPPVIISLKPVPFIVPEPDIFSPLELIQEETL